MIQSMTAFAAAEHIGSGISSAVEIRSYNHRYLDIALRLSRRYCALEEKIKSRISQRLNRGRIEINVQILHHGEDARQWEVDEVRADAYHDVLTNLQQRYGLTGEVPLEMMAKAEGVLKPVEPVLAERQLWEALQPSLEAALNQLCRMREDEGAALAKDLRNHLDQVQAQIQGIERQAGEMVPYYQARLTRRIDQITRGKIEVDPLRIAQEVAFQADRSDISEELVRCASHLDQFRAIMAAPEAAGRKLNFLLQELNRELNTIGAKAEKARIAHRVVDAKAELEKIREQVQNVE